MLYIKNILYCSVTILCSAFSLNAHAQGVPNKELVTSNIIQEIRDFVETDIVRMAIANQNSKYASLDSQEIIELDEKWRTETKADTQPLISATLSNPLSAYLTRVQAHSLGLYSEIFAMDKHGLNVGQSNISSDYWQGDEDKFQKTYPIGARAIFIDEPEYHQETRTWRTQVNLSIPDTAEKKAIGAITVEVNLTELARRSY